MYRPTLPSPQSDIVAKKAESEPETAPAEQITKTEAVKRALADGVDKPVEGVEYVRSKFGIEMTNQGFSTAKFQLGKKAGKPAARRGRAPRAMVAPTAARSHQTVRTGKSASASELARQIKALVDAYGAAEVKGMVAVFGG
jgi:hypothetical protein